MNELEKIASHVSLIMGIDKYAIKERTKKAEFVVARSMTAYLIRNQFPLITLKDIGEFLGGYNHSTVLTMIQNMQDDIYKVKHLIDVDLVPKQMNFTHKGSFNYHAT